MRGTDMPRAGLLRGMLPTGEATVAPGVVGTFGARMAGSAGFTAAFISSHAVAIARFGLPEPGRVTLNDLVDIARRVAIDTSLCPIPDGLSARARGVYSAIRGR